MLPCFVAAGDGTARAVEVVAAAGYRDWLAAQPERARAWLDGTGFEAKPAAVALLPGASGAPERRLAGRERAEPSHGTSRACARACRPATGASKAHSRPAMRRSAGRSRATASSATASARPRAPRLALEPGPEVRQSPRPPRRRSGWRAI